MIAPWSRARLYAPHPMIHSHQPTTLGVLRFSSAGDVLLVQPALTALRRAWPQLRIVFMTYAPFAPLVQKQPQVDEVVALSRQTSLCAAHLALKKARPQIILDLQGKWRTRLLSFSMRGTRRVVWHKRSVRETLAVRLGGARVRSTMHMAHRYHAAAEAVWGAPLPRAPLHFVRHAGADAQAKANLAALGIVADQRLIGISPGAMWATKRWPAARFASLCCRLRHRGLQVVLTGSVAEAPLHAEICAQAPGTQSAAGQGNLAVLASLIACCDAFVANDSGPMHLARAVGVRVVAIFGCTDPTQFDMRGHALLYAHSTCAPCSFYGRSHCPRGHLQCLHAIDVEQAEAAVVQLLAPKRPPPLIFG